MDYDSDWKKMEKELYAPGTTPVEVELPPLGFFVLDGKGDPNGPEFSQKVGALYALAYQVRMSGVKKYRVYPLEGVWDLGGRSLEEAVQAKIDRRPPPDFAKEDLLYRIMIRQPEFITPETGKEVIRKVLDKKRLEVLELARFEILQEGRCVQMLHNGPFEKEKESFAKMREFCRKESLARIGMQHREIYLSDPKKSAPEKLKTILRFQVRDDFSCV